MPSNPMSRRQFLKTSAVALSGAVIAACGAAPTATPAPQPTATKAAAAAAPATGGAPQPSPPIRLSAEPSASPLTTRQRRRNPATDLFFQKFYPNMKPAYEVTPSGYEEKLLASIASGDPPNLAYVHESRFASFASQGAMMPLDDLLAKTPLIDGNDKYPLDVLAPNNKWQGKWLAFPYGAAFLFMAYNKSMFQKASVPLPKEGWTWQDFFTAMTALTKDTTGKGTPDQWGWIGWNPGWMPAQWPLKQSHGSADFNDTKDTCIINNDAGVQILDMMRNTWVGASRSAPTPAQLTQLQSGTTKQFEGGKAAATSMLSPNVNSTLANIAGSGKFDMGIEIYPAGPKGPFVRTGGSEVFLPKGDKYPQVAWELTRYLIGDEEAGKLAATYKDGNPLLRLDHILKYNVPEGPLKPDMVRIITNGFQKYGTVVGYSKLGTYGTIWSANCDKMAAGDMTAKQTADAIAAAANKELKG